MAKASEGVPGGSGSSGSKSARDEQGVAPPIDKAADSQVSRLQTAIKDAPDKPSETTVAQVQELADEEPGQ